ncbi:MAG: ATP-dependent helicase, partial [Anaerolineae bacterium]
MKFEPRASQRAVLAYHSGKMGISAVPGSGKTATLAVLAAGLVQTAIADDQEVLIVTLVNSAVDNFKKRIDRRLAAGEQRLLPGYGYRVRTLHGLAHDVVRERPGLVGLADDFGIIDEREADAVREDAVDTWLRGHPEAADPFLARDLEGNQAEWVRRTRWPRLSRDIAAAFIKRAKDRQLTPEVLLARIGLLEGQFDFGAGEDTARRLALARMGAEIYGDYQRSLAYRGVVDFDDLIRLALEALKRDEDYLARLRHRWPYILEDEAQDSSHLQQEILQRLAGEGGNWVRVGDPNQAIYETFTTASPDLFLAFLEREGVVRRELPESGRSQPAILALANRLIDWVQAEHPRSEVRTALALPHIEPTPPGDPQPNPPADWGAVQLVDHEYTPEAELKVVADSLARWSEAQAALPEEERETCAALTPRNQRGFDLSKLLQARKIEHVELLRSTSVTRATAGALGYLLRCLADPTSARKLAGAFRVWRRDDREDAEAARLVEEMVKRIQGCPAVEAYLWPRADHDWLAPQRSELAGRELSLLEGFRDAARRWHRAAALPIDQLILTLAGEIFDRPAELALSHKLAALLRDVAESHPTYRLTELVEELAVIARNERRFLGFAEEDGGFEPPRGKVTVSTMHKAKGLEWDRVYLLSANNYNFPSGLAHDRYISEPWFVRDGLNLEAEALEILESLVTLKAPVPDRLPDIRDWHLAEEGEATKKARLRYVAERLRLLYVGVTRARRSLLVTWNTGRRRDRLQPAVPFIALHEYWQGEQA